MKKDKRLNCKSYDNIKPNHRIAMSEVYYYMHRQLLRMDFKLEQMAARYKAEERKMNG